MSQIEASIPLGVQQFKAPDQMNMLAQILQIQGAQNQNELAKYTIGKARREDEETNAYNQLWKGAIKADGSIDRNALYSGAAQQGLGSKIPGLQKQFNDADEAKGKVDKQKVELVDAKLKQSRQFLDNVRTPEEFIAWHKANHSDPVLGPELASRGVTADQAMARIQQALQQPGGFEQLLKESALGLEKFTELNKPTVHMQDTGASSNVVSVPGLGGAPTVLSSTPITQSANNKATVNASLENAKATRDAAATTARATRDAAQITGNQNTEMKLGDDYRAQSKNFKETADAYKQITSVLDKATTSPAATLAGATKFMKMIDPGSVVRESELGMALAATGVFDRATNYFNTLQSGKVLTASQVKDFKDITKQINDAASQQQKLIDNHYSTVAKQYGLRPEMVVQDFGQNTPAAGGGVPPDIAAILQKHGGRKGQ